MSSSDVWASIPPTSSHWRMTVGEIIEGTFQNVALIDDPFGGDEQQIAITIEGRQLLPHKSLTETLRSMRVQPGDLVRIERLDDRPIGGGKRTSVYKVDRPQNTAQNNPQQPSRTPSW